MLFIRNKRIRGLNIKVFLRPLLLIIAISCFHNSYGQNYYFKHYNIEDGLVQSQVSTIFQDKDSYLWTGTLSGVSRFNGNDFVNYTKINGIKGNLIYAILQTGNRIWMRTDFGISSLE